MAGARTITDLVRTARGRIRQLAPGEALAARERGALLVDIRCQEQRVASGVIPGSVHVPLSVLFWRLDPSSPSGDPALADPGREVVLICAHGYSSSLAAATLVDLGYAGAADVAGGFEAWKEAGLPVEPLSLAAASGR